MVLRTTLAHPHSVLARVSGRAVVAPWILSDAVEGLKFADCLPEELAVEVVARRLEDITSTDQVLRERLAGRTEG
jgi:hypothetical protein